MDLSVRCLVLVLLFQSASAQTTSPTPSATQTKQPQASSPKDPDSQIVTSDAPAQASDDLPAPAHNPKATPAQREDEAWTMLTNAVTDSKHTDLRIQGLAALGTMGSNPHSISRIAAAMQDKELDVRTAAILAAGQTNSRNLTTDIRALLDDKEPQVAYTAAITLWKMNDRSGEDILMAVAEGDRSATPTMVNGTRQSIGRSLRHPGTLARFGAIQGTAILLGPFGFGIGAYEYMRKNSAGDLARVTSIELLSQEKTEPIRKDLIAALDDKDVAVRAAAAKALGNDHDRTVSDALFAHFTDPKAPVRLTASAAFLNSIQTPPTPKSAMPKSTKRSR